jgi:DNA-3-methyladenine glycosylase I
MLVRRVLQRPIDNAGTAYHQPMPTKEKSRCAWAESDPLLRDYHDTEWGVPVRDSRALWELLMLEGFQAGLAWIIVLRKRDAFRKAFKGFDPTKVARFNEADIARMLQDLGIIRSRAKIEATIQAARIYLEMQKADQDFASYLWDMIGGKSIRTEGPIPAQTPLAVEISKQLKKRGFKFVGPVIVYAFMQASGMVNDHSPHCFRCNAVSHK